MHQAVYGCLNITEAELNFLSRIEQQMRIVADLSRADILMYGRQSEKQAVVLVHARPHSLAHVYAKSREGYVVDEKQRPEVLITLTSGLPQKEHSSFIVEGAPVMRKTLPVMFPPRLPDFPQLNYPEKPRTIATLVIVTNLLEYERHRLRSKVFRQALKKLQAMLPYGQVSGAENLSPFGEQDGLIFVDPQGVIRYASGIAANLYRRLGYKETLMGRPLANLETADEGLRQLALAQQCCQEQESREGDRFWTRKALPLIQYSRDYWQWLKLHPSFLSVRPYGVMLALHDDTEVRRQDQEIRVKNAMIQEVHHRVKNNLQTIAGLLRLQSRRVKSEEAKQVLDETLNRILSIAVIHEFLSSENTNIINIKEVSQRIMAQFRQGILNPDKDIQLELNGEPVYLPARQATACSLIINELIQNALEHGFEHKQTGFIQVNLIDEGDEVMIKVADNGDGLPPDFQLDRPDSLGLNIVKILVEGDLKGHIDFSNGQGVVVTITFPKTVFQGEEGWSDSR